MKITTVNSAAEIAGVTPGRIRILCRTGVIFADRVGRDWIVDTRSLSRWMRSRKNGRPPGNAKASKTSIR